MRIGFIGLLCLAAASLAAPSAFAQRARVAEQRGGTSYLGIGVAEITPDRAKALNLKEERGAEVKHVDEDGPAAKAGIKEGDVVLQYNGENVEGIEQFIRMVRETPAGRPVKLVVWRNGAMQTFTVTVGERKGTVFTYPGGGAVTIPPIPPIPQFDIPRLQIAGQNQMLGIEGESLGQEQQLADFFGVRDGVLVKQVIRNSAAEKAGIRAGDVITKIDGVNVGSTREITSELRSSRARGCSAVTIVRDKKESSITVNFDDNRGCTPGAPGEKF